MRGLVGQKLGMTRFFSEDGLSVPVTIVRIAPNYVTQIRRVETDGYFAVQVAVDYSNSRRVNKPELGHIMKSGVKFIRSGLWEFRMIQDPTVSVGDVITVRFFENIKKVDVTGVSKGKGFSGVVKRWNFRTQDASHGNSLSHRAPGSIGQNQTPGRVFKGKKMAGHLGSDRVTIQNLEVINVDLDADFLLIKGAIPGIIGASVIVKRSVKIDFSGVS